MSDAQELRTSDDERTGERPAEQAAAPEAATPETAEPAVEADASAETITPDDKACDPETATATDDSALEPRVPGSLGYELAAPVIAAGIVWTPTDAVGSPIGAALAAETVGAGA